ncbi:hypothetical protein [Amycolatopsis albispora]|uniref:Uncharacterized protein n=1 Tax=Amycolatopsis albispora TaxID=1804986 RepID=A0A344LHQ7_9PSEU|nr:hypothetical protein [Amycolatopsis albispora]AXB47581.1 hypothetical protein A4R43_38220 [Amycolatopsis albispora]
MAGETGFNTQAEAGAPGGAPPSPPPAAGDAGSNFLDSLFAVDPLDDESVKQFSADVQRIKDLASAGPTSGGFALEPEAGQKFIGAVSRYIDEAWPSLRADVVALRQRPELGSGPYATRVAEHDGSVMDGDDASLIPNLELLEKGLITLREAIQLAIGSYREGDEEISMTFKAIDKE